MTEPSVSVCMPAYNAEGSISQTIDSVLAQTHGDFELVVVDDASTDGTVEVVRSYEDERVRLYVNEENTGQARATNRALGASRGEFVKFLHDDDMLAPECLTELARPFAVSDRVGLAFSRRQIELEDPDDPVAIRWKEENAELHGGFGPLSEVNDGPALFRRYAEAGIESNWVGEPSCVMVRRAFLTASGTFNLRVRLLNDLDLWLRLMARYDVGFIDTRLCTYRFGASGVTGASIESGHHWLDKLWILEGLATFPDIWARFPPLPGLRRAEVTRQARELASLGGRGRLRAEQVSDAIAYARYRALWKIGRSPALIGSLPDGYTAPPG